MAESRAPKPPPHLGPAGRRLWRRVQSEYVIEGHRLDILETAAVAADRLEQARQLLAAEGLVVDRGKLGPGPHPAIGIESTARTQMLRALRELALSEDLAEAPRPPMITGRYRTTGT